MRVTPEEIKEAYYHIRKDEGDSLRYAAERIRQFHERQRTKTWMYQEQTATLGQMVTPLDAVGVYVPGGKAAILHRRRCAPFQRKWRVFAESLCARRHRKGDQSLSAGSADIAASMRFIVWGSASDRRDGVWHEDHREGRQDRGTWECFCRDGERLPHGTVGLTWRLVPANY